MNDPDDGARQAYRLTIEVFSREYLELLERYALRPGEGLLLEANELGRRAMECGIGLLDVVNANVRALETSVAHVDEPDRAGDLMAAAASVLLECLAPYEVSVQGFWDKLDDARRKSEEDVKAIFASAQDGVLVFDENRALLDCNAALARMLGFTRGELKELAFSGGEPGSFGGITDEAMEQLADLGYFDEYEREFLRSDGSRLAATISGSMIGQNRDGDSWRAFAFVKDVTDSRRAEEALRRSEERYRTLFESSIDGIVNVDMEGRVLDANRAYLDMLGYSLEELHETNIKDITPPKWHEAQKAAEAEMLEIGYSRLYEKEYRRKDGSLVPVSLRRWVIRGEDGLPAGEWSIVRDITQRKQNERDLQRINAELDGFARSVSHDLRGPLSAILLANETLLDTMDEDNLEVVREDIKETQRAIRRNLERSYALIDDLLTLAESGQRPLSLSDVDIAQIIGRIIDEHYGEIEGSKACIELSEDLGIVRASQTHIYQLFSNLIMNAIHHNNDPNPRVRVKYFGRATDGKHSYEVCDNGQGIPEAHLEDIFDPFFKGGPKSRTGVGLAIVEKVISVYGGQIRASNRDGACFTFTIADWPR